MPRIARVLTALAGATLSTHALAQSASPDEVRAIVAEMVADADERSSLLAGGTAGHDGGFYLASDDGAFKLGINGFVQFRYYAGFRDEDNTVGDADDFSSGFQMRRIPPREA